MQSKFQAEPMDLMGTDSRAQRAALRENEPSVSRQAEQRLMESEERHRLFFEQSRDAMMTLTPPSWRFTTGNPATCAMYGVRDEAEFVALGPWDVSPERQPDGGLSAEKAKESIKTALREGSHFFEWTHRTLDGRDFPTTVLLTRMTMAGQTFVQAIVRDITAQKRAEEALAQLAEERRILLDNIQTQIWYLTDDHTYGAVNRAHADFSGRRVEDMAFKSQYDIFPQAIVDACRAVNREVFATGQTVRTEEWLPQTSGEPRLISILKSPKRRADGSVEYIVCSGEDITERRRAELAEQQGHALNNAIIDSIPGTFYMLDDQGRFVRWNAYQRDEIMGKPDHAIAGMQALDSIHPDDRALIQEKIANVLNYGVVETVEGRVLLRGGPAFRWLVMTGRRMTIDGRHFLLGIGIGVDIAERKEGEAKLHLAASVFTHAREGIVIATADGSIVEVNESFTHITGYGREEVLGRNPRLLKSGRHSREFYAALWRALIEKGHWSGELWNRRKNGEVFATMQTISAVHGARGDTQHYVALFSDITALKEHQRQLEHIAHYDALTTLPNRVLLADRLHQAMVQTPRRGQQVAVVYLDLDGFKAINDRHGHEAGDQLLIAVAARMKETLRQGDTLARLGGDEFVAVLVDLTDSLSTESLLHRLLAAVAEPVQVGKLTHRITVSLGVTFYPQVDEVDADQLLRQADQAMYQAKLAGKNRYHLFDAEYNRNARGHHESLEHIRHALLARQFVLYYQPKVNMRAGTVVGAEALIRWRHPERGLLPPVVFLPVIEDHPLAVELGEWVIATALTQMEEWHALGLDLPVSVNIGARQLQQIDFVERLRALLAAHPGVKPSCLGLELLETSALEDLARVSEVIAACRALGVMCALDDFGTGYSSLTYLKRLPVNLLKIDQSFVRDMLDDPEDLAIVQSVLGLAAAFRREAIAEGVETLEHGERLLQLGCELAQGYGIARPMPADEIPGWSAAWRPDPRWTDPPVASREMLHP
ncbi:EAL domain-containing protein [uncultured Thiocystis sp.]|jgi:diguanylate cyclase (GGDEF)-like protein/PAS domain S-box-containing protein|uniref:sensor domain-containing protein n=1 Tax=uncultured Thiocystis sp. TaxID=1202134 RepID=UPI0025D00DDD|nr:EAL domain-containing protein [uncultured Thiocystis sp.]